MKLKNIIEMKKLNFYKLSSNGCSFNSSKIETVIIYIINKNNLQ
jgi:hypothetical protein